MNTGSRISVPVGDKDPARHGAIMAALRAKHPETYDRMVKRDEMEALELRRMTEDRAAIEKREPAVYFGDTSATIRERNRQRNTSKIPRVRGFVETGDRLTVLKGTPDAHMADRAHKRARARDPLRGTRKNGRPPVDSGKLSKRAV